MFQDRKGKGDFGWEWRRLCSLVLMQIREFQRERKKEIQRERERERERKTFCFRGEEQDKVRGILILSLPLRLFNFL
jgi:hypothetical protein